ncbi:MAG TPA: alpha/beta hydrolase [Acetobacteraceae bacterium]|nr:alpha/beta hydrolase [Acetobacteraceae bacterium]
MLAARPRPAALSERRARLDTLGEQFAVPPDVRLEAVDANGVAAEWTTTPGADPGRVILFLHGGGYVSGSIVSHRAMAAEAGRQAGARTLALGYRLAPENPYPAALRDAVAGYQFLLSSGIAPRRIAIGGDSAGGGLTIATVLALRDAGAPLPGCAWCLSPWTDLEMTGASMAAKAAVDPMVQKEYLQELTSMYLAPGADPRDPLVSPLHADLRGLPPLLVQVGSAETLLDDAVRLAGAAAAADVAVTLEVYAEMIHVWPLFHQILAPGREALAAAGRFIRARLDTQA